MIERLIYNGKHLEDEDYLISYFGRKYASKILADAYHIRSSYKKQNNIEEQKRIAKDFIENFDRNRKSLIENITKRHVKVIKDYEIVSEMAKEILHPSSRKEFQLQVVLE